ncbi:MAG TPA: zinc ABC transporter substrate-binding protein [Clostridiales bacterium]|nr:zinc ABC transporter substrate-binding protein [Clostridiales bacterium]
MKKKLFLLISVMIMISIAGSLIINIIKRDAVDSPAITKKGLHIVTTFYPMYLIGLNMADQIDALDVQSLTQLNTGCLHDYQLTTEDMKLISNADVLIINGGGMESFLEDVRTNYPKLTIIDTTQGITLLNNKEEAGHEEGHNDEAEHGSEADYDNKVSHESEADNGTKSDPDHETEQSNGIGQNNEIDHDNNAGHDHDHGEYNAHVWLDPELYIKQIEKVRDGLIQYINDKELAQGIDRTVLIRQLEENADRYISSVEELNQEMESFRKALSPGKEPPEKEAFGQETSRKETSQAAALEEKATTMPQAVVFHDSFAYLANKVGIEIAHTISLDSDTSLSAGDIAEIIDEVRQENIKYLFTEQQYSDSIAKQIAKETNAKVYIIDSVVTGNTNKDSYLTAMRENLNVIRTAIDEAGIK